MGCRGLQPAAMVDLGKWPELRWVPRRERQVGEWGGSSGFVQETVGFREELQATVKILTTGTGELGQL